MSRRLKLSRQQTPLPMVQQVEVRCPVDETHSLGAVKRDVGGVKLWSASDKSETVVNPPKVPLVLDRSRLRWTCPACRRAGLYEDRQVRFARVMVLMDAMAEARVSDLRIRLDPVELTRHTERLRAAAEAHNG